MTISGAFGSSPLVEDREAALNHVMELARSDPDFESELVETGSTAVLVQLPSDLIVLAAEEIIYDYRCNVNLVVATLGEWRSLPIYRGTIEIVEVSSDRLPLDCSDPDILVVDYMCTAGVFMQLAKENGPYKKYKIISRENQ